MKLSTFGVPAVCAGLFALAACEAGPTQSCRFELDTQILTLQVGADTIARNRSVCNTGTPVIQSWSNRNPNVLAVTPSPDMSEARLVGRAVGSDTVSVSFSNGRSVAMFVTVTQ
jgi:hypothetical protein